MFKTMDKPAFNYSLKSFGKLDFRHIEPVLAPEIEEEYLNYSYAEDMSRELKIKKGMRSYSFLDGSFYFGDFIEAFIIENNLSIRELTVSTLSLNQNNIDSFAILLNNGYVQKLNLIVSHYFFSHERSLLIPYIYDKLDIDNKFQLVVMRTHCKIVLIDSYEGYKFVFHGSANLRSSGNIEQLMIEENEELYDFNYDYQKNIIKRYYTIKKEV